MHWSFSIGRVLGTDLRIHATFFLLLAWVTFAAWATAGPAAAVVNVAFVLAVFACVILHELGHALMARRFGVRTPDITLLPIGGLARLERIPEDPRQEILIAVAGPLVNVGLWILMSLMLGHWGQLDVFQQLEDPSAGFLTRLAAVNLILVLFNMIPAFPMDGGRVFRAVLALYIDRISATRLAANIGQLIAFLFGFLGLTNGNPLLVLIAVFIFFAAGAESTEAEMRERAHHALARDATITKFETLSPSDTLEIAGNIVLRTTQSEIPVIDADGRLEGMVTRSKLLAEDQSTHAKKQVSAIMVRDIPSVNLLAPMDSVLDAMQSSGAPAVAIANNKGQFIGYITRENIGEWLILSRGAKP